MEVLFVLLYILLQGRVVLFIVDVSKLLFVVVFSLPCVVLYADVDCCV